MSYSPLGLHSCTMFSHEHEMHSLLPGENCMRVSVLVCVCVKESVRVCEWGVIWSLSQFAISRDQGFEAWSLEKRICHKALYVTVGFCSILASRCEAWESLFFFFYSHLSSLLVFTASALFLFFC